MGAFNGLIGNLKVKEELREELRQKLLKLMSAGGMVAVEAVNIYDKQIILLKDISLDEDGDCSFHYNYISDEAWEEAGISKKFLWSEKVGSAIFSDVIFAGYTLCSLYSDECCIPHMDAEIVDEKPSIAWINNLLHTNYTENLIPNYWLLLVSMHNDKQQDWPEIERVIKEKFASSDTVEQIVTCLYVQHGFMKLTGCDYVAYDKNAALENWKFVELLQVLKDTLKAYKAENSNPEQLFTYLQKSREEKLALVKAGSKVNIPLQLLTLMLHVNSVVYLKAIAEEFDLEFWELWDKLGEGLQDMGSLVSYRQPKEQKPQSLPTEQYLKFPWFAYWFNRNELIAAEAEKDLTKDDLLYYYVKEEGFPFSDDMKQWFEELGNRYQSLCEHNPEGVYKPIDFTKILISLLYDAQKIYHCVYAFQNMFYEFLANPQDIRYQSVIKLLEELIAENRPIAEKYEPYFRRNMDMTHPNVWLNSGRMCIKRYLALLANTELRKQIFNF